MKSKIKKTLTFKWTPHIFVGIFVLIVTSIILISSITHDNDWYESQEFRYKLERKDSLRRYNTSLENVYEDDYFFKILSIEQDIILFELDYYCVMKGV